MNDARRYAVWPDPRSKSRSRAIQSWKSGRIQKLSPPPFTKRAGNWPRILKLGHNVKICSGRIFDTRPSFCVMWLWSWQKRQLWRVDCQSRTGLIYLMKLFLKNDLQTIIMECDIYFGFQLPSIRLSKRSNRFDAKYSASKVSLIYRHRP